MRTIRSQMIGLFLLLMAALLALGIVWSRWENGRADRLAGAAYRDKCQFIRRIVDLKGASTQNLAEDYTYWDEMVRFVAKPDPKWAAQNLDQSLSTYKATGSWVYDRKGRQIYAARADSAAKPLALPFGPQQISNLFRTERLRHFFINTGQGLLEIRGATIHPTADPRRKGPWYGYFLVGRLWDAAYLHELADLTGCRVTIAEPTSRGQTGVTPNGVYVCAQPLAGSEGIPSATVRFQGSIRSVRLFRESTMSGLALFVVFVLLIGGAIMTSLHNRVGRPLARLSASLQSSDTTGLEPLSRSRTEVGEFARLIGDFFQQRELLEAEMAERKQAEEQLRDAQSDLERRVRERTAELQAAYLALHSENQERKQAEDELSKAEAQLVQSAKLAALGTLCAGVAHELNQPVAVIRGLAQQMLAEDGVDEQTVADLALIEGQTTRMMKIISHLRKFSRATQGDFERIDISEVTRNCFVLVGQQLKAHNIRVELQMDPDPMWVLGDGNELEQVILNLINNARDAMEGTTDAVICIRTWRGGDDVTLEFRDNGPGIPDHAQKRLFDPFFTTKEPGKGTGLGLSISHTIIQKHGGTIRARNDGGAVFTIQLPRAGSRPAADSHPMAA